MNNLESSAIGLLCLDSHRRLSAFLQAHSIEFQFNFYVNVDHSDLESVKRELSLSLDWLRDAPSYRDLMDPLEHMALDNWLWRSPPAYFGITELVGAIAQLYPPYRRDFIALYFKCCTQVLKFLWKVETAFTEDQLEQALEKFRQNEEHLSSITFHNNDHVELMRVVVEDLLGEFIDATRIVGRDGPGSNTERLTHDRKFLAVGQDDIVIGFLRRTNLRFGVSFSDQLFGEQLPDFDPYDEFLDKGKGRTAFSNNIRPDSSSELIFVPKDKRGPRSIALEPLGAMHLQLGLADLLRSIVEKRTRCIRLADQSQNQKLAREGSLFGNMATIDMSDASDLVHCDLVTQIFGNIRVTFEEGATVTASRSLSQLLGRLSTRKIKLPNGDIVSLWKYASMGNGLTFIIETIVFYASVIATLSRLHHGEKSLDELYNYPLVSIYGDDLIVPSGIYDPICDDLETLGLKVNRMKSFNTGPFRESCGKDYLYGQEVQPVYLRKELHGKLEPEKIISILGTANQLAASGYNTTADYLFSIIETNLGGDPLPWGTSESSFLNKWCYPNGTPTNPGLLAQHIEQLNKSLGVAYRWNKNLQRVEFKVWQVVVDDEPTSLPVWARIRRAIALAGSERMTVSVRPSPGRRGWKVERPNLPRRAVKLRLEKNWCPI